MFTTSALCVLLAAPGVPPPDPAAIAKMAARKLEMNASHHVRVRVESRGSGEAAPERQVYTVELWRAGDKFRFDVFDAESAPPPPAGLAEPGGRGARDVTCQNCERPGHVLTTVVYPGSPAITGLVEFHTSPAFSAKYAALNTDWRFLGLHNTSLHTYNLDPAIQGYQSLAANPKLRLSRQSRGDKPCLVASLELAGGQSDLYLSEAERNNPVLRSFTTGAAQEQVKVTTEVDWRPTPGDHLYPSQVRHTATRGGKVQHEEVITVLHADFHSPVDPAVFTVAGLGLNENQQIAYPGVPFNDQPRWRDGKVDPSASENALREAAGPTGRQAAAVAPYPDGGTFLVLSIVFGAVALAAFAAAVVYRRLRGT